MSREDRLSGPTYVVVFGGENKMYITINEQDGRSFEVFLRQDLPELHEWAAAVTILITRLLRAGESLSDIAKDLKEIHSPVATHWHKRQRVPSLPALIGSVLEQHVDACAVGVAA